jgi:hypothetical protein
VTDSHTVLQRVGRVGTYNATHDPAVFQPDDSLNQPIERLSDRTFRLGARISF